MTGAMHRETHKHPLHIGEQTTLSVDVILPIKKETTKNPT